VSELRSPFPDSLIAPIAKRVEYSISFFCSAIKGTTHGFITGLGRDPFVVTIIILKVIDFPFGVLEGIIELVMKTAWLSCTGVGAS
jgi:hypothetical protein